jgi:hypothetical protein
MVMAPQGSPPSPPQATRRPPSRAPNLVGTATALARSGCSPQIQSRGLTMCAALQGYLPAWVGLPWALAGQPQRRRTQRAPRAASPPTLRLGFHATDSAWAGPGGSSALAPPGVLSASTVLAGRLPLEHRDGRATASPPTRLRQLAAIVRRLLPRLAAAPGSPAARASPVNASPPDDSASTCAGVYIYYRDAQAGSSASHELTPSPESKSP